MQTILLRPTMPTYGHIEQFSAKGEDWDTYVERLTFYLSANDLEPMVLGADNAAAVVKRDTKRKSILLCVINPETYTVLRSLCTPTKPDTKSFNEICILRRNNSSPAPEIVERFKFNTRVRQPGESMPVFMAELRKLAEHCNFGDMLSVMLRDRLMKEY